MTDISEVGEILRLLGIGGNFSGHRFTAAAVMLTMREPDRLLYVTKLIYEAVGQQFGCSWQGVERAVRFSSRRAWTRNPQYLMELARYPLEGPPTSSEFIDILASHFLRSGVPRP